MRIWNIIRDSVFRPYESICGKKFGSEDARINHYVNGCEKCEELHAPDCQNH